MDNNQRYSEFDDQFNDLPLPGEEQAWQQMKELLDKEDDNRKPVVPIFLRSCMGWGLGLLLVGAVTWFIARPDKWWNKKEISEQNHSSQKQNSQNNSTTSETTSSPTKIKTENSTTNKPTITKEQSSNSSSVVINEGENRSVDKPLVGTGKKPLTTATNEGNTNAILTSKSITKSKEPNPKRNTTTVKEKSPVVLIKAKDQTAKTTDKTTTSNNDNSVVPDKITNNIYKQPIADSLTNDKTIPGTDIIVIKDDSKPKDTLASKENVAVDSSANQTEIKEKANKKSKLIVSAGIGLQQQIPFSGQQAVPYDYYGRKGSLSDYIPSVYLRLEKEKKWFVQAEFRYGAPQTLKDFSYSRQTKIDSLNLTVTTYRLKKTYYHQLPVSFNYFVLPNLSVGVGGIYSRFYGAVTEKEVKTKNLQTQVETASREIVNIKHFNDSFLYKTQVHVLLQAEYHWRRFDFGLRYTKDVQPYIKYTKPDGQVNVEKNQTLQAIVRYRLWSSKKK